MAHQWRGVIREYFDRLDVDASTPIITLGEGGTPLVFAPALAKLVGAEEVWLKVEGMNPTGSFKDRGMTMAVSKAVGHGAKAVICASTGNTSASAAAYAAAAGIQSVVLVPEGKIALGKLSQAVAHKAQILQVQGNFDDWSTRSTQTALRVRRPQHSKSSSGLAMRQTFTSCRSAMPETTRHISRATSKTSTRVSSRPFRKCGDFRLTVLHLLSMAPRSKTQTPSQPLFASAIRLLMSLL